MSRRFNIFSAGNFLFTSVLIVVGMHLAGMLDEFSIIDLILPFGFAFGLLFLRPISRISEKTCTRFHWRIDIWTIVWASVMLFLWVSLFGGEDRSTHNFYVYILYAAGLLIFQKFILLRGIYGILGDQFEPKCKTCSDVLREKEFEELIEQLDKESREDHAA